jgi:hypothetical protein
MTVDARSLLLASALGVLGCDGAIQARALDRVCATILPDGSACETKGVVKHQSGVTSDATGFRLEDGSLVIHLAAVPEARAPAPFDIEALAVARLPATPLDVEVSWGSCGKGCPASPLLFITTMPTEHAWIRVASGVRGAEPGVAIPYDARLTFTGAQIELVDLRFVSTP